MLCCHLTTMWLAVQVNAFARASHSTRYIPRVREASAAQQWQPARLFRCQTTIFAAEIYFLVVIVLHGNTTHWLHTIDKMPFLIETMRHEENIMHFLSLNHFPCNRFILYVCVSVSFRLPIRQEKDEKKTKFTSSWRQLFIMCLS